MTGPNLTGADRPLKGPRRLAKRADFLRVAKGARVFARAFALRGCPREGDEQEPRVGFTVTKKTGGSVERNRIRRRLREVLRVTPDLPLRQGHDYVLVARRDALSEPFSALQRDVAGALLRLHDPKRGSRPARQS